MVTDAHVSAASPVRQGVQPLLLLCVLGLVMVAFVAGGPWIIRTWGYAVFVPCLVASGVMTIAATTLAPAVPARAGLARDPRTCRRHAAARHADEPFLSSDIYRYVWDGRVQAAGINPYAYVPADAALAAPA